jgi:hypothetical protein
MTHRPSPRPRWAVGLLAAAVAATGLAVGLTTTPAAADPVSAPTPAPATTHPTGHVPLAPEVVIVLPGPDDAPGPKPSASLAPAPSADQGMVKTLTGLWQTIIRQLLKMMSGLFPVA